MRVIELERYSRSGKTTFLVFLPFNRATSTGCASWFAIKRPMQRLCMTYKDRPKGGCLSPKCQLALQLDFVAGQSLPDQAYHYQGYLCWARVLVAAWKIHFRFVKYFVWLEIASSDVPRKRLTRVCCLQLSSSSLSLELSSEALSLSGISANLSEATYAAVREPVLRRSPDLKILSHYLAKKLVAEISGVVSVLDDMCINSCTAFVGPLSDAEGCPDCHEPQGSKKVPRQQACTILVGPQLQALWRSPQGAAELMYRDRKTREILGAFHSTPLADRVYDDIFSGSDLRQLMTNSAMTVNNITDTFSIDSAQLYLPTMTPRCATKRDLCYPHLSFQVPTSQKTLMPFCSAVSITWRLCSMKTMAVECKYGMLLRTKLHCRVSSYS